MIVLEIIGSTGLEGGLAVVLAGKEALGEGSNRGASFALSFYVRNYKNS